jgi:hypothetical protein
MAQISPRFGSGGANLTPGGASGTPSLVDVLRDIADDLAAIKPSAPISVPDAGAAYGANEQALLNALKAAVNALAAVVLKTTKTT